MTTADAPWRVASRAAARPEGPPPTMTNLVMNGWTAGDSSNEASYHSVQSHFEVRHGPIPHARRARQLRADRGSGRSSLGRANAALASILPDLHGDNAGCARARAA